MVVIRNPEMPNMQQPWNAAHRPAIQKKELACDEPDANMSEALAIKSTQSNPVEAEQIITTPTPVDSNKPETPEPHQISSEVSRTPILSEIDGGDGSSAVLNAEARGDYPVIQNKEDVGDKVIETKSLSATPVASPAKHGGLQPQPAKAPDLYDILSGKLPYLEPMPGMVVDLKGTQLISVEAGSSEVNSSKKSVCLGSPCIIVQVDEDAGNQLVSPTIQIIVGQKVKQIRLKPNDIQRKNLENVLVSYGAFIAPGMAGKFAYYLQIARNQVKTKQTYTDLGFQQLDGKLAFCANEATDGKKRFGDYTGQFDLTPKGNENVWMAVVKKLIVGHPALELIFCIAVASIVAAFDSFTDEPHDFGPMVINLWGKSSTGKTTAMLAALSIFDNPVPRAKGSMVATFSSTLKSMVALLRGNYGYLQAFDEIGSKNSEVDISGIIYDMGKGAEMRRLDSDSHLQAKNGYLTYIMTTGEESLYPRLKINPGIYARLVEFRDLRFTEDAKHAEQIKADFAQNYGWGAIMIAEHLMRLTPIEYRNLCGGAAAMLEDTVNRSEVIQRFRKTMSTFLIAERLCKKVFGFDFDEQSLLKNLHDAINHQDRMLNADAYFDQQIQRWIKDNYDQFGSDYSSMTHLGFKTNYPRTNEACVAIPEKKFEELALTEWGADSAMDAAKILKRACSLRPDKGSDTTTRLVYRRTKPGTSTKENFYRICMANAKSTI